jgi:hypothetical protein
VSRSSSTETICADFNAGTSHGRKLAVLDNGRKLKLYGWFVDTIQEVGPVGDVGEPFEVLLAACKSIFVRETKQDNDLHALVKFYRTVKFYEWGHLPTLRLAVTLKISKISGKRELRSTARLHTALAGAAVSLYRRTVHQVWPLGMLKEGTKFSYRTTHTCPQWSRGGRPGPDYEHVGPCYLHDVCMGRS